jgi:hypothetical protein
VTKLYMRQTAAPAGTPTTKQSAGWPGAGSTQRSHTNSATPMALSTTIGSSAGPSLTHTHDGSTAHFDWFTKGWAWALPVTQAIAANTWTIGLSGIESNGAADTNFGFSLYVYRPGTGVIGYIWDTHETVGTGYKAELASSAIQGRVGTVSGAAVAGAQSGDLLVVEIWAHVAQTMASAYTHSLLWDHSVEPIDGQSGGSAIYISTPQDLESAAVFKVGSESGSASDTAVVTIWTGAVDADRTETPATSAVDTINAVVPTTTQVGELLLCIAAGNLNNVNGFTFPAGWTYFVQQATGSSSAIVGAWRVADGTEGPTVTVTSVFGSAKFTVVMYRIPGAANPATSPIRVSSPMAVGTDTAPDPPSLSPPEGSKDWLWLAMMSVGLQAEADDDTWATAPSGYEKLVQTTSGTAGGAGSNNYFASATRKATTATEDPGPFSQAQSVQWGAVTVAIPPAGPPTTPKAGSDTASGDDTAIVSADVQVSDSAVARDTEGRGTDILKDTFTRSVTDGWGTPDIGSYTVIALPSGVSCLDVASGVGTMTLTSAGDHFLSLGVSAADIESSGRVKINQLPPSSTNYVIPGQFRRTSATAGYNVNFSVGITGAALFRFYRMDTSGGLGTTINFTYVPDTWYRWRIRIVGTSLKARLWVEGTAEPSAWDIDFTDSLFSAPGDIYMGTASFSGGNIFTFDDLLVQTWDEPSGVQKAGSDTAVGTDTVPTLAKAVTDAATGTDTAPTLGKTVTDTSVGADVAAVTVPISVTDSAVATDISGKGMTVTDTGSGADTAPILAKTVTDAAVGMEAWVSTAQAAVDSGTGADTSALSVPVAATDTAVGVESIPTLAKATTDSGTASDVVSALTRPVTDSATASDAAAVGAETTAAITNTLPSLTQVAVCGVGNYAIAVLVDSPVGFWKMGDASGNLVRSAGSIDLAPAGTGLTYQAAGLDGQAVSFAGTGRFDAPSAGDFALGVGTIEAWFKTTTASGGAGGYRGIIVKQFAFGMFANNGVLIAYNWAGGGLTSNINIADNRWHHAAFAFTTAGTSRLYLDGIEVWSGTWNISNQTVPLVLGDGTNGTSQPWIGTIDEAAVYNTQLSPTRVLAHYNAGLTVATVASALPSLTQSLSAVSIAPLVPVFDSFDRADGAIGTSTSGHTWIAQSGTWNISTNRVYRASSEMQSTVVIDSGFTTCSLSVDAIFPSGLQDSGMVFAATDDNNYLLLVFETSPGPLYELRLWKRDAGVFTLLAGPHAVPNYSSTTKRARVEWDAANGEIEIWFDYVQITTVTLGSTDRATYALATRQGLRENSDIAGNKTYFDNYSLTPLAMPALSTLVMARSANTTGWSDPASDTTMEGAGTQVIVVTAGV